MSAGGLELFREFLRIEFSEENLEFWLACERYRLLFEAGEQQQSPPTPPTPPQPRQSQTPSPSENQCQSQSQTQSQTRQRDSGGVSAETLNALLEDTALSSCSDAQNMKQLIFDTYLAPLSSREARLLYYTRTNLKTETHVDLNEFTRRIVLVFLVN